MSTRNIEILMVYIYSLHGIIKIYDTRIFRLFPMLCQMVDMEREFTVNNQTTQIYTTDDVLSRKR